MQFETCCTEIKNCAVFSSCKFFVNSRRPGQGSNYFSFISGGHDRVPIISHLFQEAMTGFQLFLIISGDQDRVPIISHNFRRPGQGSNYFS
jgi:hypothetical protein